MAVSARELLIASALAVALGMAAMWWGLTEMGL